MAKINLLAINYEPLLEMSDEDLALTLIEPARTSPLDPYLLDKTVQKV